MLNFPEIPARIGFAPGDAGGENKILKFWKEKKIFEKLRKKNQGKIRWSFLDGPITANNPMAVHHAWGRTYKDLFQRFKAMQGFDQRFQNGFDCQGLHVEVEVEKELGFKSKKDIEKYGIAEFVEKCKERAKKYAGIQTQQSIRLGQWMDWDNSYYTMSDENNYAIWNFLKKCHENGYLYKGRDVVPWCPRCGTAISQHEILTEEYKEIVHKAIFLKLPVEARKNTFFLVWTTTPWTLPSNVALAVHPDLTYIKVQDKKGHIFILLKEKANLISGGKIIEEFLGKDLESQEYKGMFDELEAVKGLIGKEKHRVVLWKDITQEEGTGIVHIAPGCGQEDFKLSKEFDLSVIDPTDQDSRYKGEFGFLAGKLVTETRDLIFENLKEKGFIYKIEDYTHRYPTCWRCKEELIFRLVDEWYISMEKLRKPLIKAAKEINWIPSFGLDRELDWLKNMQDWLISKKRYWGLALPIFECSCGNFEVIGSKEELKEKAVEGWEKFAAPQGEPRQGRESNSPHRPWVDEVKIKCSKCGKIISRILDVGNPWLDAGIVPFSTMAYQSDKKYWEKWFPAELVCESFPGQFKNWFYSIIVMSVVLENTAPVKTIFGYASVHDEKDEEMHKSKGNAIWFDDAVEKIGADPMRWLYAKQNPAENLKFGYKPAEEIKRKLLTLYNVFVFFKTYVKKEEFPAQESAVSSKNILDKWIISKLNNLILETSLNFEKYNAAKALSLLESFFNDDLSLWYLRRSRSRFHPVRDYEARKNHKERESLTGFHQIGQDKEEAVKTLYYVLLNLTKLIAPVVPFFAEEIYADLKTAHMPESIHLCDWPQPEKKKINKNIEEKMDKSRNIVNLALARRAAAGIKVRQPLAGLKIKDEELKNEEELLGLIKEEVNVKEISFDKGIKEELELDINISDKLKEEGEYREIIRNFRGLRKELSLLPGEMVELISATFDISIPSEVLLKEVGAKKYKKIESENEMNDFDARKEINLDNKKYWIGIKK